MAYFVCPPTIWRNYRVFIKYCVFPRISKNFATSPSLANTGLLLVDQKTASQYGVTVHSDLLRWSPTGRGWVAVNWRKKDNFQWRSCIYADNFHFMSVETNVELKRFMRTSSEWVIQPINCVNVLFACTHVLEVKILYLP